MKRHGNLWPELIAFPNLLRAARQAERAKRFRLDVTAFHFHLERELWTLHTELAMQTHRPGPYRSFTIYEPKPRLISAAPYRDRVVHHALCHVLEPIFERCFSFDSYACRKGKGTHAAVRRCQELAWRHHYVFQADIRKFFPSIHHAILHAAISRKIKDPQVLGLAGVILANSNPQEPVLDWFPGDDLFTPAARRRGLPIGNQTSQFVANDYLDPFNHFVQDRLRTAGYVRYVDDFLIFANDKRELAEVRHGAGKFLGSLRLRLHPTKNAIFPITQGIGFLGYRENVWRFRRRLREMQQQYARGDLFWSDACCRIMSWMGHAQQADTYRLRERLLFEHPFRRAKVV
jgi:retron-type reverse transcriptase